MIHKKIFFIVSIALLYSCSSSSMDDDDIIEETTLINEIQETTTSNDTASNNTTDNNTENTPLSAFREGETYTNIVYNIWVNDNMNYDAQLIEEAAEYVLASDEWGQAVKNSMMNTKQIFETGEDIEAIGGGYASSGLDGLVERHTAYNGNFYGTEQDVVVNTVYVMTHELTHDANFYFTEEQLEEQNRLYEELLPLAAEVGLISDTLVDLALRGHAGEAVNVPPEVYHHGFINDFEALVYMSQIYVDRINGVIFTSTEKDNELLDLFPEIIDYMRNTEIIQ